MTVKLAMTITAAALCAALAAPAIADTDVSHNWNAENEAEAMRIFRDKYVALGGTWKDTAFPESESNTASVKTRVIGGTPPMAMQASFGGIMIEFAENGLLQDMNAVAEAGKWTDQMSESIAETGKYDGTWVAAPVFVDVINWLYTNNEVLAAAGVEAPTTWEEFKASLPKLKAAGVTPLAVGGQSWQEAMLFDQVILGVGGTDLYKGMLDGDPEVLRSEAMLKALEEFGALREFTDEGKSGRSWNDTSTLLLTGKAGYFFMGPWAAGSFADMGPEGGKWSCRLTPWADALSIVPDGFVFLAVSSDEEKAAQKLFADAVMDPATQVAAAKAKGTLPATDKVDPGAFEGCPAKAVAAMAERQSIPHMNTRPVDVGTTIKDTVTAFWSGAIDARTAQQNLIDGLAQ